MKAESDGQYILRRVASPAERVTGFGRVVSLAGVTYVRTGFGFHVAVVPKLSLARRPLSLG